MRLQVAIGISVIAAVWCLKSLDIGMYPYYYHEIQIWRAVDMTKSTHFPLQRKVLLSLSPASTEGKKFATLFYLTCFVSHLYRNLDFLIFQTFNIYAQLLICLQLVVDGDCS